MRRLAIIFIVLIAALSAAAQAVSTARAPPVPVSSDPFVTDRCGFDVRITLSGKAGAIQLPGGDTIVTSPGLFATLSWVDDPQKQVTFNATGPYRVVVHPSGDQEYVLMGHNLVIHVRALGDPISGISLVIGRFTFVVDAMGQLVRELDGAGRRVDVCALLA